jgi:thymidylate kinase
MKNRTTTDGHESNIDHLVRTEKIYQELANIYKWKVVECVDALGMRNVDTIHYDVWELVKSII